MKSEKENLTICEIASILGVTRPTLRLYEKMGLIRPQRTLRGTRLYERTDLDRMELILRLKRGGFKLQKIHDFIVLDGEGECPSVLSPKAGEIFEDFTGEITRQMACLEGFREELIAYRRKIEAIRAAE